MRYIYFDGFFQGPNRFEPQLPSPDDRGKGLPISKVEKVEVDLEDQLTPEELNTVERKQLVITALVILDEDPGILDRFPEKLLEKLVVPLFTDRLDDRGKPAIHNFH